MMQPNYWDQNRLVIPPAELPIWLRPQQSALSVPAAPLGLTPSLFAPPPPLVSRQDPNAGDSWEGRTPAQAARGSATDRERLENLLDFNRAVGVLSKASPAMGPAGLPVSPGALGLNAFSWSQVADFFGRPPPAEPWPGYARDFYISQTPPGWMDPGLLRSDNPDYPGYQGPPPGTGIPTDPGPDPGSGGPGSGGPDYGSVFSGEWGDPGFRRGGPIPNRGSPRSDPVPIVAHEGEYVLRAPVVAALGRSLLDAINMGLIGRRELEALLGP